MGGEYMHWDWVRFVTSWMDLKRLAFVAAWYIIIRDDMKHLYGDNAMLVLAGCFIYIICYIFYKAIVDRIKKVKKLSIAGNTIHMDDDPEGGNS